MSVEIVTRKKELPDELRPVVWFGTKAKGNGLDIAYFTSIDVDIGKRLSRVLSVENHTFKDGTIASSVLDTNSESALSMLSAATELQGIEFNYRRVSFAESWREKSNKREWESAEI